MSYTPPNTLVASTVLEAAVVEGNFDELRVYRQVFSEQEQCLGIIGGSYCGGQCYIDRHS